MNSVSLCTPPPHICCLGDSGSSTITLVKLSDGSNRNSNNTDSKRASRVMLVPCNNSMQIKWQYVLGIWCLMWSIKQIWIFFFWFRFREIDPRLCAWWTHTIELYPISFLLLCMCACIGQPWVSFCTELYLILLSLMLLLRFWDMVSHWPGTPWVGWSGWPANLRNSFTCFCCLYTLMLAPRSTLLTKPSP